MGSRASGHVGLVLLLGGGVVVMVLAGRPASEEGPEPEWQQPRVEAAAAPGASPGVAPPSLPIQVVEASGDEAFRVIRWYRRRQIASWSNGAAEWMGVRPGDAPVVRYAEPGLESTALGDLGGVPQAPGPAPESRGLPGTFSLITPQDLIPAGESFTVGLVLEVGECSVQAFGIRLVYDFRYLSISEEDVYAELPELAPGLTVTVNESTGEIRMASELDGSTVVGAIPDRSSVLLATLDFAAIRAPRRLRTSIRAGRAEDACVFLLGAPEVVAAVAVLPAEVWIDSRR